MDEKKLGLQTRAIHAGKPDVRIEGAMVLPIFQCTVYEHKAEDAD